jgi:hypothetical protein
MRHAQKAIELDLATAALDLCMKTTDDVDTLFVGLIEAAQNIQKMCCDGEAVQEKAEISGHQLPLPGKPSPRRKSDAQPTPTPTPTTANTAAARADPELEARLVLTEVPPLRLELSGQQRRLARLATVEAQHFAARDAAIG